MKKRIYLLIILSIFLCPIFANAETKYIYDVLKEAAEEGTFAKEYTGEHQDSITREATDKIYHWYAESDAIGSQIMQKNNVVFGGFCWKILRTTDIGGVRMFYNGKVATDGTCNGTTTEPTLSFDNRSQYLYNYPYYYASSYTYDESTNKYILSDDATQITYDGTNIDQIKNKYTCLRADTNPCDYLYYMFKETAYNGGYGTYVLGLSIRRSTTRSASIGTTTYNDAVTTPNGAGYMLSSKKNKYVETYWEDYLKFSVSTGYSSYDYVGDGVTWSETNNRWELINPKYFNQYSTSQLAGKYTFGSYKYGYTPRYIISASASTYSYYNILNPSMWQYVNIGSNVYYSDTYTDNNDGTYTLGTSYTFPRSNDYSYSHYSTLIGKYVCFNGTPETCYELWYVDTANDLGYFRASTAYKKLYSTSYTYSNGKYHLSGNYYYYWNSELKSEKEKLNTYKYTCRSMEDECDELYYVVGASDTRTYFTQINNGEKGEEILEAYFTDNDDSSNAKLAIDYWYEHELIDYADYLEDSVYCNNRSLKSTGGWAADGNVTESLEANKDFNGNDLKCFNETDKLSVSNPVAKLKYPIALPNTQELQLSKNNLTKYTNATTWLMTPDSFLSAYVCNTLMYSGGQISSCSNVSRNYGLSPEITLKKGSYITSGTGTESDPYVVSQLYSRIIMDVDDEEGEYTINLDNVNEVPFGETATFTVTPKKGYTLSAMKILDDDGNEITYNTTDNDNEYSFTMPASSVRIRPVIEKIPVAINPETRDRIILVVGILILSLSITYILHKKETSLS